MKLTMRGNLFMLLFLAFLITTMKGAFAEFLSLESTESSVRNMYGDPQRSGMFTDEKGERMKIYWYGKLPAENSGKVLAGKAIKELLGFFTYEVSELPLMRDAVDNGLDSFNGSGKATVNYLQKNYKMILYFNSSGKLTSGLWPGKNKGLEPPVWNSTLTAEENKNRRSNNISHSDSENNYTVSSSQEDMGHKEESIIVTKEPKHVYVDSEDVCHRPYCKNIRGIEKSAMKRFESLEQALQDENKKCDSCMASELKK